MRVVFDVNVFVMAVADSDPPLLEDHFDRQPPLNSNAGVLSIAIILKGNDDGLFPCQLFVSPHILRMVIHVLKRKIGWPQNHVVEYINFIRDLAVTSGGDDLFEPTSWVTDCGGDHEDGKILALALDVSADLLVTEDGGLLHLSPWRGRLPIIQAQDFGLRANDARSFARHNRPRPIGRGPA